MPARVSLSGRKRFPTQMPEGTTCKSKIQPGNRRMFQNPVAQQCLLGPPKHPAFKHPHIESMIYHWWITYFCAIRRLDTNQIYIEWSFFVDDLRIHYFSIHDSVGSHHLWFSENLSSHNWIQTPKAGPRHRAKPMTTARNHGAWQPTGPQPWPLMEGHLETKMSRLAKQTLGQTLWLYNINYIYNNVILSYIIINIYYTSYC